MTDAPLARPAGAPGPTRLQGLLWPEAGLCTEPKLYFRLKGPAAYSAPDRALHLAAGGRARFDTYFNLFPLGLWQARCGLNDIRLALTGRGRLAVEVVLARPDRSWERVASEVVTLADGAPFSLDLSGAAGIDARGVLYFSLTALEESRLEDAAWETAQPPLRTPDLTLSMTTFRREAAAARAVERFRAHVARSPLAPHLHLLLVDNGRSAGIAPCPHVTPIDNANLGGAGGFARGLIEARARGDSHCLFMDDDAAVHMESLDRTWMLLAYATDPATAVAGAMISAENKAMLWENGAVFDTRCIPQHIHTDLREADEVMDLAFDMTLPAPDKFYGGWWFFAFPVDRAHHLPFPFFVRGDDVSFSLVHDFDIATLPGVVSFQEGFIGKESPLSWYLDLRSHLAHHLSLKHMELSRARLAKIPVWFYLRNLIRLHYETMTAINIAVEDVLEGPDFFAANADLATRRADLAALRKTEAWGPAPPRPAPDRIRFDPKAWLPRTLMKLTLNGHLLPFFRRYGNRITVPPEERGAVRTVWGAAAITVHDAAGGRAYTVTHSKAAAWREGWRLLRNLRRLWRERDRLQEDWRAGYDRLTGEAFWRQALALDAAPAAAEEREDIPA